MPQAAALKLHVFDPGETEPPQTTGDAYQPDPAWTLLDFYLHHVKPKCLGAGRRRRHASPQTMRQYEIALWRWWQAFTGWTGETLEPGDPFDGRSEPRLGQMTDDTCEEFLDFAFDRQWHGQAVSDATVRKWVTHLNFCLLRSGPRIGTKKHFARVVVEAPQIEPPEVEAGPPPDGYSLEQIHNLLGVCDRARPLPRIQWSPSAWWRAVFLFAYNTAMRPETLFGLKWDHFPPGHELNEPGSTPRVVDVPKEILKGRRNTQRIWINDAAAEAIAPLRRPSGRIFGWPWPTAESTLRHELNRLLALAGIPRDGKDDPSPFYGFRRAFATQCIQIAHEAAPIAATLMMNHKPPNLRILLGHYANPIPLLQQVLPRLPQPGLPKQKLLF